VKPGRLMFLPGVPRWSGREVRPEGLFGSAARAGKAAGELLANRVGRYPIEEVEIIFTAALVAALGAGGRGAGVPDCGQVVSIGRLACS